MIEMHYIKSVNEVVVSFSNLNTDIFYEILDIVKEQGMKYEKSIYGYGNSWHGSPHSAFEIMTQIANSNLGAIDISKEDYSQIYSHKDSFGDPEMNSIDITIDDKFMMKYPPIIGKRPNENFQRLCIERGISQDKLALFLGMRSEEHTSELQSH